MRRSLHKPSANRARHAGVVAAAWAIGWSVSLAAQPVADTPPDADALPFLTVDRDAGVIDLEAVVVLREAAWLELLACSPNTREHESILAVPARPSHIHLALLTLGLEPGEPLRWEPGDDGPTPLGPTGPPVRLTIIEPTPDGPREVPAHTWVRNQLTGEPLPPGPWLFAGSEFKNLGGQTRYTADLNGTVASLVGFGDDLLARPTTTTNNTDQQQWAPVTKRIPPVGTRVILRLRPEPPGTPPPDAEPGPTDG